MKWLLFLLFVFPVFADECFNDSSVCSFYRELIWWSSNKSNIATCDILDLRILGSESIKNLDQEAVFDQKDRNIESDFTIHPLGSE